MGKMVIKDHLSKKGTLGDLRERVAALLEAWLVFLGGHPFKY